MLTTYQYANKHIKHSEVKKLFYTAMKKWSGEYYFSIFKSFWSESVLDMIYQQTINDIKNDIELHNLYLSL